MQLPQRKAESNIPPIEEIISQETHALARRLKKVALAARLVISPRGLERAESMRELGGKLHCELGTESKKKKRNQLKPHEGVAAQLQKSSRPWRFSTRQIDFGPWPDYVVERKRRRTSALEVAKEKSIILINNI